MTQITINFLCYGVCGFVALSRSFEYFIEARFNQCVIKVCNINVLAILVIALSLRCCGNSNPGLTWRSE